MKRKQHAPEKTICEPWQADRLLSEGWSIAEFRQQLEMAGATIHRLSRGA